MSERKKTALDDVVLLPASAFSKKVPRSAPRATAVVIVVPESGKIPVLDEALPASRGTKEHVVDRALLEAYIRKNPHCRQVDTDLVRPYFSAEGALALRPVDTIPTHITDDSPGMPFVERPDGDRSPLHYGQMKLFASEMKFLTTYTGACSGELTTVVYAGAAPGHHIPLLAKLFPSCQFLLYDPAAFCRALVQSSPPNVKVFHDTFFTEDVAAALASEYEGKPFVFISDIRTGKEETYVREDMERQKAWVHILNPMASMVKFRLPWQSGKTRYLDGEILLPVYAPLTSTECRLITTQGLIVAPDRVYDNQTYERACAYHNTVGRVHAYAHDVAVEGLDHCHDCAAFGTILCRIMS